jgi:SAM-dependent methyltransferase
VTDDSTRAFYDDLAADYDLIFPNWDASIHRQAAALDGLLARDLGGPRLAILDCACGIGTQVIGLAALGHRVVGSDLSPAAVVRARHEARQRGLKLPLVTADMTHLPFAYGRFDVIVCADNAIAHLLIEARLASALAEMHRVLRPGGLLVLTTRSEAVRETHPQWAPPQHRQGPAGRVITFQLWDWHPDGEHYDLEHIQLHSQGEGYTARVRRTTSWALRHDQVSAAARRAGFGSSRWHDPGETGFPQPILTARS